MVAMADAHHNAAALPALPDPGAQGVDAHHPADLADPAREAGDLALLTGERSGGMLAAALRIAGGELIGHRPRQVVHQPGGDTTVSYRAQVRWRDGQERPETLVACTGDPPEGSLVLDDGIDRVAVWRFPHDPDLPGLAAACDEAAVAGVLVSLGLGEGAVRLRTRAYRPRRRAVIEATGPRGRVFIKVVRPDRVAALHDRHRLLVGAGIPAPQSLGWTRDGILVQQALGGRTLRHALRSRAAPVPTGGDIVALLDRLPADLARGPARQSWLELAPHYAAVVGAALPGEAARAADLAEALTTEATTGWTVPTHGDLYENQILVDDRGRISGLLDVDTAGPGDQLDDLACLLGHLSVLAQIDRDRAPLITRAAARYQAAFEATVPADQLRYRVAAVVVSLATGSHRVQEAGWPAATRRRLELADRWLAAARALRVEHEMRDFSPPTHLSPMPSSQTPQVSERTTGRSH
jgi:hypothetical protein